MWEDKIIEESSRNSLSYRASELGVLDIASVVTEDERFDIWSGSSHPKKHHFGTGGLKKHTLEVVNLCFDNVFNLNLKVNEQVLFLGALFHDFGKIWDYNHYDSWSKTEHARTVGHLSRSLMEWTSAADKFGYKDIKEQVAHMIISHHGRREWGSPMAPKSKEAWLLHLCDNLSARMDDCETFDNVDDRKF